MSWQVDRGGLGHSWAWAAATPPGSEVPDSRAGDASLASPLGALGPC